MINRLIFPLPVYLTTNDIIVGRNGESVVKDKEFPSKVASVLKALHVAVDTSFKLVHLLTNVLQQDCKLF